VWRNILYSQQPAYQRIFEHLRGFGDVGPPGGTEAPEGTVKSFLEAQGEIFRINPEYLSSIADRASHLILGRTEGLRSAPLAYREFLDSKS